MHPTEMMIPLNSLPGASCKVSWRMGAVYGRVKHPAITLDRGPAKESLGLTGLDQWLESRPAAY